MESNYKFIKLGGNYLKKKKTIWIFLIVVLISLILSSLIIKSLTTTKYGKINILVAVMLKIEKYFDSSSIEGKSIAEIREYLDKNSTKWSRESIPFSNIKDIKISTGLVQVPVRIYTPEIGDKFPIIIYSHGGSWISGNLDTHDNICRKLSKNTNAIVVSVDYRLAPENPFPAGLNDVYNVVQWVFKNAESIGGNSKKLCVAGDSAGGNLSAAVSQMIRDNNAKPITCQILIYPATNIYKLDSKSWTYFSEGYLLTRKNLEKYISLYTPHTEDRKSPYASPILAENLRGLPDALIITAEFDPLRDDGEVYAEKLKESGVSVTCTRYKGVTHGFVKMDRIIKEADAALNEISAYLEKEFTKD